MKKMLKTTTALTLAAALAFPVPYSVLADGNKGYDLLNVQADDDDNNDKHKKHGKFGKSISKDVLKDIQSSYWAKQNIEMMFSLGLISGYPDGTFQPNKPVSNAEAVVMTMNMLGLQEEAKELENETLPFKDANAIPSYAKGSVALAVEMGIIADGGVFQPNKGATRMDIVSMIVLALGEDSVDGLQAMSEAQLQFTDVSQLTEQQRKMLAFAVVKQLVAGYEDKTFKPNKPVTRAEFATIIIGVMKKHFDLKDDVQVNYKVKGEVVGVNATAKTVTVSHKSTTGATVQTTFNVAEGARIYRNDKVATLVEIKATDRVDLVLDANNKVVFLTAKGVTVETNYLNGEITAVATGDRSLSIKIANMLNVSLKVATDASIELNGKPATFEQLSVNDKIKFSVNASGQIHIIKATSTTVVTPTVPTELQNVSEFNFSAKSDSKEVVVSYAKTNTTGATVILKTGTTTTTLTGTDALNYIKALVIGFNKEVIDMKELSNWTLTTLGLTNSNATVSVKLNTTDRVLQLTYVAEADGDLTAGLDMTNKGVKVTAQTSKQGTTEQSTYALDGTNIEVDASKKIENNTTSVESKIVTGGTTEIYVGTEFSTKIVDLFKSFGLKLN